MQFSILTITALSTLAFAAPQPGSTTVVSGDNGGVGGNGGSSGSGGGGLIGGSSGSGGNGGDAGGVGNTNVHSMTSEEKKGLLSSLLSDLL